MKKIRAIIDIIEEGDLGKDGFSGMRPSFNLNGEPITSEVVSAVGCQVLDKGARHEVIIALPYGEVLGDHLGASAKFRLQVGGRLLATGTILSVVE